MIDPASFQIVTAVAGTLQSIMGLAKGANNAELNQNIIELQSLIFELQGKLITLQNENEEMASQIDELTKLKNLKPKYIAYWVVEEQAQDGPFCQLCGDANKKLVRMRLLNDKPLELTAGGFSHHYYCDIHKIDYYIDCDQAGRINLS